MDFNIGNLVSAVMGAVAKVAIEISNLVSAVIGFEVAFANANEDGEIDDEEAEELLADYKLLVGAYIALFGLPGAGSESDGEENSDDIYIDDLLDSQVKVTDGAAVTYDENGGPSEPKSIWDCVLGVKDYFGDSVKDFTIGAGYSVDNNMFFGVPTHVAGMNEENLPDSTSCKVGRVAGDVASLIGSGGEIAAGTGGEVGGVALDATGAGAIVGVPINVGSAVLVSDGVVNGYRSTNSLADDLYSLMSSNGGSNGGRITAKEAKKLAEDIGFQKINETSHGQPVFYNKKLKKYITPDVDGHNGGAWKMADSVKDLTSKKTRLGTYDANLNRIGD